jgi:hypothetical protein
MDYSHIDYKYSTKFEYLYPAALWRRFKKKLNHV